MLTTRVLPPAGPIATDGPALARVLHQAGVAKSSVIRVTGPSGPIAALWLCRHGFERAAYVHANRVRTMRSADVLLVPHACANPELATLIRGGECLRERGALIVQTAPDASGQTSDELRKLLETLGYEVENSIADKGRVVCIARRLGAPVFKKAA
jgi:hypothetical protein